MIITWYMRPIGTSRNDLNLKGYPVTCVHWLLKMIISICGFI